MAWEVEVTDQFLEWWDYLTEKEQEDIGAYVNNLKERGPTLPFPYSSDIEQSKHGQMRELRVQSSGDPIRVFYAFDPRRVAILLIGGDKTGNDRFYDEFVPIADRLFDEHLAEIKAESKKEEHRGKAAQIRRTDREDVARGARARRRKD